MNDRLWRIFGIMGLIALMGGAWLFSGSTGKSPASLQEDDDRTLELGTFKVSKDKGSEQNVVLNDPAMNMNWGLSSSDAARAWQVSHGSREVVVALARTLEEEGMPDDLANELLKILQRRGGST